MPDNEKNFWSYRKHRIWTENLSIVMQIGLTMAGCIIFCFFVGRYLDIWLGTTGVFVTIFTVLGIIGGGNTVYRQILKITKDKDKNDSANGLG